MLSKVSYFKDTIRCFQMIYYLLYSAEILYGGSTMENEMESIESVEIIEGVQDIASLQNPKTQNQNKTIDCKAAFCNAPCCANPSDIFTISTAVSYLLYQKLNTCQLNTIINLITLISANLSSFVTQIEINEGVNVQPPF